MNGSSVKLLHTKKKVGSWDQVESMINGNDGLGVPRGHVLVIITSLFVNTIQRLQADENKDHWCGSQIFSLGMGLGGRLLSAPGASAGAGGRASEMAQ